MHVLSPAFPSIESVSVISLTMLLFVLFIVWTIVIKGFALWFAARAGQKWWFIALLIINTAGILELVYILWFRPGRQGEEEPSEVVPLPEKNA